MTLSAPEHIRGRIRGVGMKAKINARGVFIRQALVAGRPVSLAPLPWEITPDARHETAPRHRGLIGARVDRNEPVDHTDRILSALMHADTLREGMAS